MRDSEIIICKGINLDKNYENVLSYSESDMVSLCRNNAVYTASNTSILGAREKSIDIEIPYATIMYANYMAYKNPSYGNKWIFAFITDIRYLSDKACRIFYDIDVWSTWYSNFVIGKAFIEREHVSDDTFGKHTLPEDVETGDYIIKTETDATDLTDVCPVVCATALPTAEAGERTYSSYCGNTYESLGYYIFKGTLSNTYDGGEQAQAIDAYIKRMNENFSDDPIVSIFMAPKKLVGWTTSGTWTVFGNLGYSFRDALDVFNYTTQGGQTGKYYDRPITFTDLSATRPTTFGSYTPVNNKCYCFPFQYINLTNNNGGNSLYNYEDFGSNTPTFEITGIITPSCSIRAVPKDYKGQTTSYNDGLQGAKYPICSWINDLFTNWMTQQGVNIGLEILKDTMTIGAGIASGLATGGVSTALGAGLASSGITGILSTMAKVREHSLVPPQARGNTNSGNVGISNNKITFTLQTIQVKEEYIRCIDSYFSRFGYKVNEVKQPNFKTRTQFNFIKVGGSDELITGDIPASDLSSINEIFRKGVTIFHDYSNFKNYTISNTIRTN